MHIRPRRCIMRAHLFIRMQGYKARCPATCSPPNRSPKAIRTRSPTRSPMRCSTRSWPRTSSARVACETLVKTGVAIVAGEVTTTRVGRHRSADAQGHQRHRLRQFRRRLRRPHLRRHQHDRQAVARHQPGRGPQEAGRPGRGRPGPDVRLRLQRGRRSSCRRRSTTPPAGRAAGQGAQERQADVAAPGRQVAGHPALRRQHRASASMRWCCPPSTTRTSSRRT